VLEGVFQDEHGDFPAGSYVRNPPTSGHAPGSTPGCTIFVKLWQFDPADRTEVRADTGKLSFLPEPGRAGVDVMPLFRDDREDVRLERWAAGVRIMLPVPGGLEVLVLDRWRVQRGWRGVRHPLVAQAPSPRDPGSDGWAGRLLSHPADFTPVCTSEFIGLAKAYEQFQAMGCDLLALSVDSLFSHLAWVRSIRDQFGVEIPFPIAEDLSMAVAAAYGMIHPADTNTSTVRETFLIDPTGRVRLLSYYPMATGRNVDELLRALAALQETDASGCPLPPDGIPARMACCHRR
jgi:peroxiredoxin (alkyl hydroperoxide reductase subunit C)